MGWVNFRLCFLNSDLVFGFRIKHCFDCFVYNYCCMVGKIGKTPIMLWMARTSTQPIQDVKRPQPNPGTLLSADYRGGIWGEKSTLRCCIFTIVCNVNLDGYVSWVWAASVNVIKHQSQSHTQPGLCQTIPHHPWHGSQYTHHLYGRQCALN